MNQIVLLNIIISVVTTMGLSNNYASNYPYDSGSRIYTGQHRIALNANQDTNAMTKNYLHNNSQFVSNGEELLDSIRKDNDRRGHNSQQAQVDVQHKNDHRIRGENLESDKSHNRQFLKTGFHHVYNKDESGSNSSYHEDSDDRGENTVYDKRHGGMGELHDRKHQSGLQENAYAGRDNSNYKNYNSVDDNNNGFFQARKYGKSANLYNHLEYEIKFQFILC